MKTVTPDIANRYLWFTRGHTRFAAAMENLQEVLPLADLRPVPVSEPSLAGLMVLRDVILPVFDPCLMLGSEVAPSSGTLNAVVLTLGRQPVFAVIAEVVGQVVSLPPRPVTITPRVPNAFLGELRPPHEALMHILNVAPFAAAMGLAKKSPSAPPVAA